MADDNTPSLAQLMMLPGANTPGGSPLPPVSPVQPQGTGLDLASIVQQVSSLPEYQKPVAQLQGIYGQEGDIAQKQQQLEANPPKTRWQPHYEPITGLGSGLRDIGKGLLQALSLTAPGQGIQSSIYGPGVQNWSRQREMLANQLQTLRGQQEVPEEQLRGLTGLTQAGGLAAYRGGELENQRARIAAYTQSVQNRLQMGMRSLDLKALLAGSQVELNKAKQMLDQMLTDIGPQRLELERYGIDSTNATRQSVANVLAQAGIDKAHPLAMLFDSLIGTSLTPAAPQAPGGTQPVQGNNPLPPRGGGANPPKPPKPNAQSAKPPGGQMFKRLPNGKVGKWNGSTYQ